MAALLDTSVLVRYLTLDPPSQGREAAALIDSSEELLITCVGLAETGYVLSRNYQLDRAVVVDALIGLLGKDNIRILDLPKAMAIEALHLCRPSGRVSHADALEWAAARHSGTTTVYTFDQSFPDDLIDRRVLGRAADKRTKGST